MPNKLSVGLLLVAAVMESAGDAIIRKGIRAGSWQRVAWYLTGAFVLFLYGYAVNKAPWRFGDLLAVYVVIFFVIAQVQAFILFGERPSPAVLIGGALIAVGGVVITIWR